MRVTLVNAAGEKREELFVCFSSWGAKEILTTYCFQWSDRTNQRTDPERTVYSATIFLLVLKQSEER